MRNKWLTGYYLLTPAFWVLDSFCGINVRTAGFELYPVLKNVYYLMCLGCAVIIFTKPVLAGVAGLCESSLNILSLFIGLLAPYYRFIGSLGEDMTLQSPITESSVINFLLAGSVAVIGFHQTSKLSNVQRD